ncbi:hypothetical protein G7092_09840 [Mucilaginibacter sp. HC2]|uniref:hypothetical protein n=1 Tax=Mucilaginibacter inviolabilis TaxID=2714892 RepID=UPI001408D932|nr:hypothetical protein [Mucilaginibacter inviolabilis]NHA04099.1 hypothetical protein [Mucilaginibacter inviolabilis]
MDNQHNSPGITDDDITRANKYKDALDALKNSINGVNSKLPEFADGLQAGLKAIGEKLPEVVDAMVKLNIQNRELAASGQQPKNVLKELASSLLSWNSLVSVGITLLTSYSGVIIDWVSDMLKGQTTLSALAKAMKDNAIITESLIQTRLKGNQMAQGEITSLNALYKATQDHNLSLTEKKRAIVLLKDQWPDTFKNISDEIILAGKAANAYKGLKEQILATAYAEAAKTKITANASRALENDLKKAEERKKNLDIISNQNKANDDYKKYQKNPIVGDEGFASVGYENEIEKFTKQRAASDKIIYDLSTDTHLLNAQNEKLYEQIEERVKKFGTGVLGNKTTDEQNKPVKSQTHQKKTADLKIEQDQTRGADLLEAQSITFAKQIELDKQHYDTELTLLNDQLSKKLISQDDYNKQAEQLQDKFHLAIGDKVQFFNKNDFDEAKKNMQDMFTAAEQQRLTIDNDQKIVDKAILPGQKLDAEKQLITDKYNYEISLAAGNADKIKELETKKQEALTQLTKQYEQQRNEFIQQAAQQVSNSAFSILQNNIKNQSDAKIKGLEKDKAAELSNKSLTSTQRQAIEAKYQKLEAAEKVKAFKSEQKSSILQAVINGALAVTKATSQAGILASFVIPGIIASTAIQVATIAAQKPPQYAQGGLHYQSDGRGALLPGYSRTDNTNAYLRSGEAVVVSEAMRNPWARNLVSAINVAHGGRDFSIPNPSRGYAIGGIFTDGGNANRYYNQPVNDVKELANTLAYQMINNFPPVYVDVKDINNQQNILAQTVNRVNL